MTTIPERRRANKAEVAAFFGISVNTVEKWLQRGAPVVQKGERGVPWCLDLLEVALWKYAPRPVTGPEGEVDPSLLPPKDRKDWYESEIKRRDLQVRDGELIPADEVSRAVSTAFAGIAQSIRSMPDDLERRFALDPEIVEAVTVAIDDHLDALAERLTAASMMEAPADG